MIQAKFQADFSSFIEAIDKAQVKLVDFGKGASGVEKRLNSMVDNFSGRKLIQEASLMTIAIEKAGGVSTLTARELEHVGAKANEAAEKLKKLGYDVPPGIQRIADAAKEASQATGGWLPLLHQLGSSWVARIAEGILLRDAIHGIINTIKDMASALPELALKGAAVADVEENFKRLTTQAGLLGTALLGSLKSGTHNTITDFELMKTVNQDLAAGLVLTDKQFGTLAKGAFALAQATGGDVKTALDTMNDAMLTGRTRALALLTGKIDVTKAEEDFAKTLGKTAANLTEAGKLEAARVAILKAVGDATQRLGEQTDGLDEKVAQAGVAWANFTLDLGKAIATSETLGIAIDGIKDILVDAFGGNQKSLIASITLAIDDLTIGFIRVGEVAVSAGGFIAKEWFALEKVFGDTVQVIDGVRLAFLYFNREVGKARSVTTGIFDSTLQGQIEETDAKIGKLLITMKQRGDRLQEDDRQQAAVDATTAKYVARLEELRDKLSKSRDASASSVGVLKDTAEAHATAGAAAGTHGDELLKLSAKETAAIEKFKEATAEVNAAGHSWQGTLDTIDGAVVEHMRDLKAAGVSLQALSTYYGLTATQAKAFTDMLAAETTALKLVDDATKEAATSTRKWFEDTAKATDEYVKAHVKAFIEAKTFAEKANDEMALSGVSGKMREIRAIEQKEKAEIDSLTYLRRFYPTIYDELVGVVHQKYGQMKAEAIGATKDIIDVAHELGLKTKDDLAANLDLARNNYEALKASGVLSVGELRKAHLKLTEAEHESVVGLHDLAQEFALLAQIGGDSFDGISRGVGTFLVQLDRMTGADELDRLKQFKEAWDDLSKSGKAATVVMAGLAIAAAATDPNTKKGQVLSAASKGAQIGSIAGPYGALVGAGIGALVGAFTSLEKKVNPVREAFVQMHGGLHNLNLEATRAGVSLTAMLNAKNPQQYQKAIDDLTAALERHKKEVEENSAALSDLLKSGIELGVKLPAALQATIQKLIDMGQFTGDATDLFKELTGQTEFDFKKMQGVADKYGIDLASLGKQFQSARLHASAAEIINDFDLLIRGGADVGGVLFGMSKDISKLVTDSLKFGTDIPANMKPWIEELQRAGLLVDDSGEKLGDLSGLKFAEPIKTEFQKIIDKLQELIDKISGSNGVTSAIDKIPKNVTIGVDYNVADFPETPIPMAKGGMGHVNGPTLFSSKGNEDFAFSGEGKSFGGGGSVGGSQISVTFNAMLNSDDANDANRLTQTLLKAMRQDTNLFRSALEGITDRRIAAVG